MKYADGLAGLGVATGDVLVVATGVPSTGGGIDAARTQLVQIEADGSGLRYR